MVPEEFRKIIEVALGYTNMDDPPLPIAFQADLAINHSITGEMFCENQPPKNTASFSIPYRTPDNQSYNFIPGEELTLVLKTPTNQPPRAIKLRVVSIDKAESSYSVVILNYTGIREVYELLETCFNFQKNRALDKLQFKLTMLKPATTSRSGELVHNPANIPLDENYKPWLSLAIPGSYADPAVIAANQGQP